MQTMKKRLPLLGAAASLAAIVALTYLSVPPGVTEAAPRGAVLSLDICIDVLDRIDIAPPNPPELHPFHIFGVIFERGDTTPIGTYRCWGWRNPGEVGVVSQVYAIFGRGSIQTQGIEGFAIGAARPVVGGNRDFMGVRGEGIIGRSFANGFQPPGCSDSEIGFEIDFHILGGLN